VTYRFCHRCQSELPPHDDGTLIYCTHCGAPQVVLSEDLQTQVETHSKAAEDSAAAGPLMHSPRTLMWAGAFRCIGLAGIVTAALMLVSLLAPPVLLLVILWMVISPVVVIGIFQARFPLTPITTGFGARIGLLTGIAVATVMAVVNTVTLLVTRFGLHAMGDWDKQVTASLEQFRVQAAADPSAMLVSLSHALSIPEFRAGFMIFGLAMGIVFLLVLTTAGGAFAGFVRSRARA
jgi:hypothetical protein